jgi:glyoxylate reductase
MSATSPPSVKPSVFLSRRVPERVLRELESRFDLAIHDSERPPAREDLLAAVAGRDGIVAMLTDRVDDELLDAAGDKLRVVANYAVGYDNVDVAAATRRGILVSNTPEVLTEATAELTIALILDVARRLSEADRFLRRGESWIWAPTFMLGTTLRGRVLGIVGLGRIGREVARLAQAFGMEVIYTSRSGPQKDSPTTGIPTTHPLTRRTGPPDPRDRNAFEWVPFEELLARAEIVSLHVPLTTETRHLIGRDELRAMREDAFLVNTTRGPVVDEAALADALRRGDIAGAALDVFEREPEVSEQLLDLENVVLVPHLGSATHETREAMGMLCVSALEAVLIDGRCPPNAVNPQVWI